MHQNSISNGKDVSRIFGLKLKMTRIHYFAYILFYTYLKTKLVLLETRLNKLSRKKKNISEWRSNIKVMAKTNWAVCGPTQEPWRVLASKNRAGSTRYNPNQDRFLRILFCLDRIN